MREMVGVAAMAAALAVVLSGCSLWQDGEKVVGQVREGIAARQVLQELADELRARDDVEAVDSNVAPVYMRAIVTVELRDTASASVIAEVTTRIDAALRSDELQPFTREFSVQAGDVGVRQTSFDGAPVDYAAELAYWGAVQSAIGTGIVLTLGPDRAGDFQRILSTETDATVAALAENYDAIVALEPPSAVETKWRLPGFAGYADWLGPVPEHGVLRVMADMAAVTNLLDDSVPEMPPGFLVLLSDRNSFPPRFALVANMPGTQVDSAVTWPLVLRMARGALGAGLAEFQVGVQSWNGEDIESANFHVGECLELNPPTTADRKLVTALTADGIQLPADAAGICVTFASP
ncbi:MAG TPA: hypothetical protein VIQ78_10540 [Terrimesophilobacter sp.]|uniref:hypothetical protein n=1 Tax=Terrimesophilobacter sp. TaxID=2906435 RepID=UPI002F93587F